MSRDRNLVPLGLPDLNNKNALSQLSRKADTVAGKVNEITTTLPGSTSTGSISPADRSLLETRGSYTGTVTSYNSTTYLTGVTLDGTGTHVNAPNFGSRDLTVGDKVSLSFRAGSLTAMVVDGAQGP